MCAKRSGLGRGLGALLGDVNVESGDVADSLQELPIGEIHPNPDQPRKSFDEAELDELADSVRQNGVLQPLVVRSWEGGYQIVAGERRYQAARRAGLSAVPAVVRDISDDNVLKIALIENLQRSDLNPMEAAQGYRMLIQQNGMTQEEVGQAVSKSRSAVANSMRLLDLPDDIQELVCEGKLSAGHARAILSVPHDDGRRALAHKVVQEGLSVRQTEILAPLFFVNGEDRVPTRRVPAPQSYKKAAKTLRKVLDAKVSVRSVRGKNRIEIEFDDEEELARIIGRIAE